MTGPIPKDRTELVPRLVAFSEAVLPDWTDRDPPTALRIGGPALNSCIEPLRGC